IVINGVQFSRKGGVRQPLGEERDLLLYLPGVDGLNIESAAQFDPLSIRFDTWCMAVPGNDRSTFSQLTKNVLEFLDKVGVSDVHPAVVAGSSFGSLLAVNVALQIEERLRGLVLINPATSYNHSNWPLVGSLIANAPGVEAFGLATITALFTTLPDTAKASKYLQEFQALPVQEVPGRLQDLANEWLGLLWGLFGDIPQESLRWRITQWLQAGVDRVGPLLQNLDLPVLVLAGSEDHMLPSVKEAQRLEAVVPNCHAVILYGVGHAALFDPAEVNLSDLIANSFIYDPILLQRIKTKKARRKAAEHSHKHGHGSHSSLLEEKDPILDYKLDQEDDMVRVAIQVSEVLERLTSPVFLSVNEKHQLERGLGGVPYHQEGNSILFVGNHQLLGLDLPTLVRRLWSEKNILARGLAHPVAMSGGASILTVIQELKNQVPGHAEAAGVSGLKGAFIASFRATTWAVKAVKNILWRTKSGEHQVKLPERSGYHDDEHHPGVSATHQIASVMEKLGAVPVSARNLLKLLKGGQCALLFPGGAKEALHKKVF
ncbi:unnamed protein product, partial [Discosporangium mesarthrocarpum]